MEKLKNENSKKRPPQAPTPHQYPGIYRIYEYRVHKASGVEEISEKRVCSYFTCFIVKSPHKPSHRVSMTINGIYLHRQVLVRKACSFGFIRVVQSSG